MMISKSIGLDKVKHFVVCFLICMSAGCLVYHLARYQVLLIGFGASMAVGVAKEVYDLLMGGKFDLEDILADLAGAICGVMCMCAVFYSLTSPQ